MKEVGVASNKEDLDHLIKAVSGKKLHDLVNAGSKKLASVPAGGAVSSGKRIIQSYQITGAPAAAGAPAGAPAKAAEKEKPKEEEAADVDMGGLFGDDY